MSVYVERLIRAPIEAVWAHTQDPDQHERWDLRFTAIEYLPRPEATEPQRFRYATRLGFGVSVSGEGESVGDRELADGSRTSVLRFWSTQRRSLILEGRGYWKYVPTGAGVRFLTSYDYTTRYGALGSLVDRLIFRPLIGWATAWSFDRLGLWLEDGTDPGRAMRQSLAHAISRASLAAIFLYHGIVPKVLIRDPSEEIMLRAAGVPPGSIEAAIIIFAVAEILLAVGLLVFWHRQEPLLLCLAFAIGTTIGIGLTSPAALFGAFNPLTLNIAVAGLALTDRLSLDGLPSSRRCRRTPAQGMAS